MERYGYLILSSAKTYDYIHYELSPNILDCLRDVLTGSNLDEETKKRIYYFKILNNEEIDDLIHKKDQKYKFGKCWLHRMTPNKKCSVYGRENRTFLSLQILEMIVNFKPLHLDRKRMFDFADNDEDDFLIATKKQKRGYDKPKYDLDLSTIDGGAEKTFLLCYKLGERPSVRSKMFSG
ncbi:uncharacterized protein TNCV_4349811 [Trichonephila clavipes]|nr:uncharacterized protein TNCV_4349811 [Trichonephila clavipes]